MSWSHSPHLVLGSIAHEPFCVCESHIAGRHSVALVVGYDLHPVMLPHAHTPGNSRQVDKLVNHDGVCQ